MNLQNLNSQLVDSEPPRHSRHKPRSHRGGEGRRRQPVAAAGRPNRESHPHGCGSSNGHGGCKHRPPAAAAPRASSAAHGNRDARSRGESCSPATGLPSARTRWRGGSRISRRVEREGARASGRGDGHEDEARPGPRRALFPIESHLPPYKRPVNYSKMIRTDSPLDPGRARNSSQSNKACIQPHHYTLTAALLQDSDPCVRCLRTHALLQI